MAIQLAPARIAINPFASVATDRHNRTAPPASIGNVQAEARTGARGLGSVNRLWKLLQERLAAAEKVLPAETLDIIKGDMDFDTMSIRTWERNSVMLDALREAMETSLCDVCETYQLNVVTTTGEDGINICANCRAASERDMVVTNEQLPYTRPAQALVASRLEFVSPCTANGVKIADLVADAENTHAVPERLFLPAPKSNEPENPSQPPAPKIYEANYDGYQDLVEDYFDYFLPTVYFVRDYDRTYFTFGFDCIIIRDLELATGNAPDIIPVIINEAGDKVESMVLWDWTPIRKQASFGDCLTALLADGYRVIVAHDDKVMTYDATAQRKPQLAEIGAV